MDINSAESFQAWLSQIISQGLFKRDVFDKVCSILERNQEQSPWIKQFAWLPLMPVYLNLQFVEGSCNANCRMCSAGKGIPLTWMTAKQVESILNHAPTASAVTLSSGNSEPTLNPEMIEILNLFLQRGITVDFFSNGISLSEKLSDAILETQSVNMINFSLDAATDKTYARIRRKNLTQVKENIGYLVKRKRELGVEYPGISVSMVEMHDNIQELPDLVDYAASIGAFRVYVEALLFEDRTMRGLKNQSALGNPDWKQYVVEAKRRAEGHGLRLQLPPKLEVALHEFVAQRDKVRAAVEKPVIANLEEDAADVSIPPDNIEAQESNIDSAKAEKQLPSKCGWLNGLWVNINGSMGVCCVNQSPDMGNIYDAPLWANEKYLKVKGVLGEGKVFPSCMKVINSCAYLAQNKEAGVDVKKWIVPEMNRKKSLKA